MKGALGFRRKLLDWYGRNARDLPWRATRDPYRIWISEIMLQQTRVAAVIPYYTRFLDRFPNVASLARASEDDLLTAWSGLGYYARARNLHRAAQQIASRGTFPREYESLRRLPGVGEYTAAAIASIAFGLPHAVVDGNVRRVLSRLACGAVEPAQLAEESLDRERPGAFNQALMELGATLCLPREPKCAACPVASMCEARRQGRQAEFPVRVPGPKTVRVARTVLVAQRGGCVLLGLRAGFWELPEAEELTGARLGERLGQFRHSITNHNYTVGVVEARVARVARAPRAFAWVAEQDLDRMPLSTMTRKALALRERIKPDRGH
jgi:A/G-specific adenine glycosylase